MLFIVDDTFYRDQVYRAGSSITMSEQQVQEEIDLGFHPNPPSKGDKPKTDPKKEGRYLSPILTHCSPADDATAKFISRATGKEVAVPEGEDHEQDEAELASMRAEFDKMGAAYDKRWGLQKTRNELLKAKKNRGL